MFLQHLLIEQCIDSKRDLNAKGRKSYVIKKINCFLAQGSEFLKQSQVMYQKSKPNKKLKP
jgi:hypothetical protein